MSVAALITALRASSGTAGISKATLEHPDAVLLDVMLPDMGGFEILEKLKSDPVTQLIPVIILSNLGGQSEIEKAVKLGAASYVIKSNIVPDEIAQMVDTEMSRAQGTLPTPPAATQPA
jgi:CheY-like chemotaxis protein